MRVCRKPASIWVSLGLLIVFGMLLFGNREAFIAGLNANLPAVYGLPQMDYYAATIAAGQAAGATFGSLGTIALGASMAMVPMMIFFNLWPNWGSTLYGEVRGASDYKRNFWGMASAIIVTAGLALVFLALINKTMGWDFYINANGAFWSNLFYGTEVPIPVWPYPVQFATFLTGNRALQILVIFLVGMWWFGWSGTVFLSSTRVIFAAALDRMLPEWVSKIQPGTKTPVNALLLMVVPSVIISYLYAYNILSFKSIVSGCHIGDRHHLLRHHAGCHPAALASEGNLRRLACCQVHASLLAGLGGHGALRCNLGVPGLPDVHLRRTGLRCLGRTDRT